MKTYFCSNVMAGTLTLAFGLTLATNQASARDFDQRTTLHNQSLFQGMAAQEVELLERVAGPGHIRRLSDLHKRFTQKGLIPAGAAEEGASERSRALRGAGWSLSAYEDGTRVKFRNRAPIELNKARGQAIPVEKRLTNQDLERRGRAFIQQHLADVVVLDRDEELVPLFTEHEVGTAESTSGERLQSTVSASTIVFGRKVGGVAVVGRGSKAAIMFTADGKPVGFDVDWPRYSKKGRKQRLHDVRLIRERASAMGTMNVGTGAIELNRFECGYVDLGSRRRELDPNAPIQAGCMAQYQGRAQTSDGEPGSGEAGAASDFIPAGVDVQPDRAWAQTRVLCEEGDFCASSDLGTALRSAQDSAAEGTAPRLPSSETMETQREQ